MKDRVFAARIVLLVAVVLYLWSVAYRANKEVFMHECTQEHKRYECEIMYK
jgi:hypothetical protein